MPRTLTGQVVKAETHYFAIGGSADLWRAKMVDRSSREPSMFVAKVLRGPVDQTMHNRIFREMSVWDTVEHPHITSLHGISLDFDRPQSPCLIFPYYHHGNIMDYVKNHPDVEKLVLITQIAEALSYLHGRRVIHGDVKGANVLIGDDGEVRLTDLGLARILEVSGFTTRTPSSTFRFMAPELVPLEEQAEMPIPRVTAATDVWAFSMCVIEIMTQRLPFSHIRVEAGVIVHVAAGGRPSRRRCPEINDDIWRMLETCWHVEPNRRPSMAELFEFFKVQSSSLHHQAPFGSSSPFPT